MLCFTNVALKIYLLECQYCGLTTKHSSVVGRTRKMICGHFRREYDEQYRLLFVSTSSGPPWRRTQSIGARLRCHSHGTCPQRLNTWWPHWKTTRKLVLGRCRADLVCPRSIPTSKFWKGTRTELSYLLTCHKLGMHIVRARCLLLWRHRFENSNLWCYWRLLQTKCAISNLSKRDYNEIGSLTQI